MTLSVGRVLTLAQQLPAKKCREDLSEPGQRFLAFLHEETTMERRELLGWMVRQCGRATCGRHGQGERGGRPGT